MKKSRFTESQIVSVIKAHDSGRKTEDICRELGISKGTFYQWRKKYSGMDSLQLRRLKELEDENKKLNQIFTEFIFREQFLSNFSKEFYHW